MVLTEGYPYRRAYDDPLVFFDTKAHFHVVFRSGGEQREKNILAEFACPDFEGVAGITVHFVTIESEDSQSDSTVTVIFEYFSDEVVRFRLPLFLVPGVSAAPQFRVGSGCHVRIVSDTPGIASIRLVASFILVPDLFPIPHDQLLKWISETGEQERIEKKSEENEVPELIYAFVQGSETES